MTSAPVPTARGDERVLIVDDEPSIAHLGQVLLEQLGYQVGAFTDPEQALSTITETHRDLQLVLTDWSMPGMSGVQLARRIREQGIDTPVLLMTGYSEHISPKESQALGLVEVLRKPFSLPSLGSAVRRVLDRPAFGPPLSRK